MNYKFYLRSDRGGFIFPTIPENLEIFSYFLSLKKKSGDKNQVLDILPVIYLKNKE